MMGGHLAFYITAPLLCPDDNFQLAGSGNMATLQYFSGLLRQLDGHIHIILFGMDGHEFCFKVRIKIQKNEKNLFLRPPGGSGKLILRPPGGSSSTLNPTSHQTS